MADGAAVLVLHGHLPYVLGHGRWPHGESWLFEAAAETYLPLLQACEALAADGVRPAWTISISPVLGEQLDDPRFREGFPGYLETLVRAAEADVETFSNRGQPHLTGLAERWIERFEALGEDFRRRDGDLLSGFSRLAEEEQVELATCARSHGLLPLLGSTSRVRTQIEEGAAWFEHRFGRRPRGMWMPECAYRPAGPWEPAAPSAPDEDARPGNEELMAEAGLEWTVVDAHLVRGGEPVGAYPAKSGAPDRDPDAHRPRSIGESSVVALPRDPATTLQVWSGEWGYPGNPWYLEFHKKHSQGGLRYWRVSEGADLADKRPYEPDRVPGIIAEQAGHFAELVEGILEAEEDGPVPVVTAPYDAELFGHWWAEGVEWLVAARRALASREVTVVTAAEAVEAASPAEPRDLPAGSWGDGGDFRVWDDERTKGIWEAVYRTEDLLERVLERLPDRPSSTLASAVRQLRRTVLLIESSDWPFLVTTEGAPDYASARVRSHSEDATRLAALIGDLLTGHQPEEEELSLLAELEQREPLWLA